MTRASRVRSALGVESELNATVLAREDLSESVFLLRVKPDAKSGYESLLDAPAYEKHVAAEH